MLYTDPSNLETSLNTFDYHHEVAELEFNKESYCPPPSGSECPE
jgi:hypothetical protein